MGSGTDGNDSARRNASRKIHHTCACGREIFGNGKAHGRTCGSHLEKFGWPIEQSMRDAIHRDGHHADMVRQVELGLGWIYLERRAAGNTKPLTWSEYRDTVWQLVEEHSSSAWAEDSARVNK